MGRKMARLPPLSEDIMRLNGFEIILTEYMTLVERYYIIEGRTEHISGLPIIYRHIFYQREVISAPWFKFALIDTREMIKHILERKRISL